jgi:hypothetical protein
MSPKKVDKPMPIMLTSELTYSLLGENIWTGRLVHEFTDMSLKIEENSGDVQNLQKKTYDKEGG